MSIVVNLFAGPGTGKSTIMAGVFHTLKWKGISCEMAPEFAKEVVWGDRHAQLDDQLYIFAKQHHRLRRLVNKVDVVITDSPLMFGILYGHTESEKFKALVHETFNKYENLNYLLSRTKPYDPAGRTQSKFEAIDLDRNIEILLATWGVPYRDAVAYNRTCFDIARHIEEKL